MGLFDSWSQGVQQGREQRQQRILGQNMQGALGGDQKALSEIFGASPQAGMQVQQYAAQQAKGQQDASLAAREDFGKLSVMLTRMKGSPQAQQVFGHWVKAGKASGLLPAEAPEQFDPEAFTAAEQFANALGGQGEQFTLAPGSKRFDASGNVVAEVPFSPANMQSVDMPDGRGGSVRMNFDPRTGQYSPAQFGGQPQTGAAGAVMDGAYRGAVDPLKDFQGLAQTPGVQVSSLFRDPQKNAAVGGVPNSFHTKGQAGDFVVPQAQRAEFIQRARSLGYDAIDEGDHVHVEPRRGAQVTSSFTSGQGLGYTPPKPQEGFQQLSVEEVKALGLPPGTVAQRNAKTGQVSVISKPDARAGTGETPLSAGEAAKVRRDFKETKDALNDFKALDKALGDIGRVDAVMDGAARGRLGTAYNNARAAIRILYNTGVLQPGELPMLETALRDPSSVSALVDPRSRNQMQAQLDELYRKVTRGIENQVVSYPQIFNPQRFEAERSRILGGKQGGGLSGMSDADLLRALGQ